MFRDSPRHSRHEHEQERSIEAEGQDRRTFLTRMTTGVAASAVMASGVPLLPRDAIADSATSDVWDETWLTRITGKHRQFFDAMTPNDGFALVFTTNFLNMYNQAYEIPDSQLTAVVGIRHFATPMAFNDTIWEKYKLGEFFKVTDPKTKAPATRNIFVREETVVFPGSSIPALQKRGVVLTMCNVALTVLSGMTADAAGLPKDKAKDEWNAGLLPGITLVPVGVLAVNRAQEKGCTYCSGG